MVCILHRRRLIIFFLILSSLVSLTGMSLHPGAKISDPFSSEMLLKERDFMAVPSDELQTAEYLEISLTTMGRGDPLYVWFGHSGLVVSDLRNERSVMYDYGIFSFDDNFYQTFALGRMNYEVWATSDSARIALAIEEDRDITSLKLQLPASAEVALVSFLNFNIQPENSLYLYHHYRENCATRIRDLLDKAVNGQLRTWATAMPYKLTLREIVSRHTASSPFIDWALNYLQSGSIDRSISLWEAMFLPEVLEDALLQFTYEDQSGNRIPIVKERTILHTATPGIRPLVAEQEVSLFLPTFLVSVAAALVSIITGRLMPGSRFQTIRRLGRFFYGTITFAWTFTVGILSLLLLFMMIMSSHDVTYFNENIVFTTPWLLVMAIQSIRTARGNPKSERRFHKANTVLAIAIGVLILMKGVLFDVLIQDNWTIMFTMLPLYIANSSIPFERITSWFVPKIDDSAW